jgi:hypothetical protein
MKGSFIIFSHAQRILISSEVNRTIGRLFNFFNFESVSSRSVLTFEGKNKSFAMLKYFRKFSSLDQPLDVDRNIAQFVFITGTKSWKLIRF